MTLNVNSSQQTHKNSPVTTHLNHAKKWSMMGRFLKLATFVFLLEALHASPSLARIATENDLESKLEFYNRDVEVFSDGTSKEVVEFRVKILNESGRTNLATQPQYYDESSQKLKIISAKTIEDGHEYPVEPQLIEDKPVASNAQGFSSYRQVLVSYPRVKTGSELYLKYAVEMHTPHLPKSFETDFVYDIGTALAASHVHLKSEIPLQMKVNDPDSVLDVHSQNDGKTFQLDVRLKHPVILRVVEEESAIVNPRRTPWISVSSFQSWKDLVDRIAPEYEKELKQPLPSHFRKIVDSANQEQDLFSKLNRVTSLLAEDLNYMGDWRTNSGRLFPRTLESVAGERRGDCKDFSTSTVAILRTLGIHANVALVRRGGFFDGPNDLPRSSIFNHAIVRVEDHGRVYWVDPTNFASYAHGLFPDIADRLALPLSGNLRDREKIPALSPEASQEAVHEEVKIVQPEIFFRKGRLSEVGTQAISLTGINLRASPETINYHLISALGDIKRMNRWKVAPYLLNSRIVADQDFQFEYEERNTQLQTSDGPAYFLSNLPLVQPYLSRVQDRVSDLLVYDRPAIFKKTTLFKGSRLKGNANLSCKVEYPWVKASRKVTQTSKGIEALDLIRVEKAIIPNDVLKSEPYARFQKSFEKCFNNKAIVVQN